MEEIDAIRNRITSVDRQILQALAFPEFAALMRALQAA
jgi:hypothetical protein